LILPVSDGGINASDAQRLIRPRRVRLPHQDQIRTSGECAMRWLIPAVVTVLCVLPLHPAIADDRATCATTGDRELDAAIAACTRLIKSGRLAGRALAIIYFERASRHGTEYYRGNMYGGKGDLDRAITDYSTAIRLDPTYAEAYFRRGNQHAAKGQTEQFYIDKGQAGRRKRMIAYCDRAIADYDQAIRLDPGNAELYRYRGLARTMRGDLDAAISDLTEAIRRDPRGIGFFVDRGRAYAKKGNLARAIADFEEALRIDPGDVDASGDLANAKAALAAVPQR
jgi:tetratricopeptide (TPR) repeat protein